MAITLVHDELVFVPHGCNDNIRRFAAVTQRKLIIMRLLADGKWHTANEIADKLKINLRSAYRYVSQMKAEGFKIGGVAGAGYIGTAPTSYRVYGMQSDLRLPAFICSCNNPPQAVKDAYENKALAQLGYHRFWALPYYEDDHARGNRTSCEGISGTHHQDKSQRKNVGSAYSRDERPLRPGA